MKPKTYLWRVVSKDGKVDCSGYVMQATDLIDLFWQIDEHLDPYLVEILPIDDLDGGYWDSDIPFYKPKWPSYKKLIESLGGAK